MLSLTTALAGWSGDRGAGKYFSFISRTYPIPLSLCGDTGYCHAMSVHVYCVHNLVLYSFMCQIHQFLFCSHLLLSYPSCSPSQAQQPPGHPPVQRRHRDHRLRPGHRPLQVCLLPWFRYRELSLGYAGESSKYPPRPTVIKEEESHQDHEDQRHLVKFVKIPSRASQPRYSLLSFFAARGSQVATLGRVHTPRGAKSK